MLSKPLSYYRDRAKLKAKYQDCGWHVDSINTDNIVMYFYLREPMVSEELAIVGIGEDYLLAAFEFNVDLQQATEMLSGATHEFLKTRTMTDELALAITLYVIKTRTFKLMVDQMAEKGVDTPTHFLVHYLLNPKFKVPGALRPVGLAPQVEPYSTDRIVEVSQRVVFMDRDKDYIPSSVTPLKK